MTSFSFCDECSEVHPLGISIGLDDGPPEKGSIGDSYRGKDPPPQVATLKGNMTICPNTGKMTSQADNNQVFLVARGESKTPPNED